MYNPMRVHACKIGTMYIVDVRRSVRRERTVWTARRHVGVKTTPRVITLTVTVSANQVQYT